MLKFFVNANRTTFTWCTGVSPLLSKIGGSCGGNCDCGCRCTSQGIWTVVGSIHGFHCGLHLHPNVVNIGAAMFQSDVAGSIIHGCLLSHHWPKGSQCWTWWSLLRPIAAQETLLSWKDFKNYVNEKIFLVAYYYKIIVQKALLSWQDLTKRLSMVNLVIFLEAQETLPSWKDLKNYVNKKTFLVAYITRKLFKKHCFLDKIYIIYVQKALSFLTGFARFYEQEHKRWLEYAGEYFLP